MYRVQGTLREWVTRDEVRWFIAKKFREFLLTYVNSKNEYAEPEYVQLINEMVSGKASACPRFCGVRRRVREADLLSKF